MKTIRRSLLASLLVLALSSVATAAPVVPLDDWLVLGPLAAPPPAFEPEEDAAGPARLLDRVMLRVEEPWPWEGRQVFVPGLGSHQWREQETDGGPLPLERVGGQDSVAFLAVYLAPSRFVTAQLKVEAAGPWRVWLNGQQLGEHAGVDAGPEPVELPLAPRKHLLVLQAAQPAAAAAEWQIGARLELPEEIVPSAVAVSVRPDRGIALDDVIEAEAISRLSLSSDGTVLALALREPAAATEDAEQWIELRDTGSGELLRSLRGVGLGHFQWAPEGRDFAYAVRRDEHTSVYVGSWRAERDREVLEQIEDFGGFTFVPGGESLVYWTAEEPEADERGVKRVSSIPDRWRDWRRVQSLWQVDVDSGLRRRLTAGKRTAVLQDIHPHGKRLLLTREFPDVTTPPYSQTELWELDLANLSERRVARIDWSLTARYGPEGTRALVLASPLAFGEEGRETPDDAIPNLYDTQAYLLDLESGEARSITRGFDPSVEEAAWSIADGNIYLLAGEGPFVRLFRYAATTGAMERLPTKVDVAQGLSLARGVPFAAYRGSSPDAPEAAYVLDLREPADPVTNFLPNEARLERVEIGRVEDWSFEADDGTEIVGRVHYPPDFDPERTYPAIVYYYGGVKPVERSFGGRYPKNVWAARGYVVYVMQPSGAVGFGQEFSARHVNDWGRVVADEIVSGTEKFLEAHPFVDRERVGAIGASYGGFMTMLLVSRTDMFRAAIAHAGISSLSSYWGEGWWGYVYSAVASAGSYPWNAPELYVEQSPLFRADEIDTPLLLLHGAADTNVPRGESDQLFVALKVLGKPVEYVQVEGEDHWILDRGKRKVWSETILAWFDRELKGEPEWWNHLYPEE
jgi:dipeptidyl aminopeptidase/acylaminoacyl peptidase